MLKLKLVAFWGWLILCFLCGLGWAETLKLKGGDILNVKVVSIGKESVIVEHPVLGRLIIPVDAIASLDFPQKKRSNSENRSERKSVDSIKYDKNVKIGFDWNSGNSRNSSFSGQIFINRKTKTDEATCKFSIYYASNEGKMEDRKLYLLLRYAYSFGKNLKWYQFFKNEIEHNRFSGLKLRELPSVGWGWWLSDEFPLKAMIEFSIGEEINDYYFSNNDSKLVGVIRTMLQKKIGQSSVLSQEVSWYPSFEESQYRLRVETEFKTMINESLGVSLNFIDEYNSLPAKGKKANDISFILALAYNF